MRLEEPSPLLKTVLARDKIFPNPFFSLGTEGPACAGELMFSDVVVLRRVGLENVGS